MPRKKPKRRPKKGQPPETPHNTPETPSKKGRSIRVLSGILAIATLLGYVVLIPRMTLSISDPVDPNDPFSSTVTITNSGLIRLDAVSYGIAINDIFAYAGLASETPYGMVLVPDVSSHHPQNLAHDQPYSFPLNESITASKSNLKAADIEIVVFYKIPFLSHEFRKMFPLAVKKQANGNFYWYAKAPPDNDGPHGYYRISGPIIIPGPIPKAN